MKAATLRIQTTALVVVAACLAYMALTIESGRESVLPEFASKAAAAGAGQAERLTWMRIRTNRGGELMFRSKIPGGWLVTMQGIGAGNGITFVPDPMHTWDGSSLPVK